MAFVLPPLPARYHSLVLGIRREEQGLVLFIVVLTFLQGIAAVLSPAIAKALFMTQFSAEQLPYAYAAVAALLPCIGLAYLAASRRFPDRILLPATGLLCALMPALIWAAVTAGHERLGAAMAIVWTDIEWALILLLFLGVATRLLDVRQQRRLLGLVAAGDVVAGILVGYSLPLLAPTVGLRPLLLVIAVVQFCAVVMAAWALRRPAASPPEEERPTPIRKLLADPFLRKAWMPLALSWFVLYAVDTLFLAVAEQRFPTEESMGAFMGVFLGSAGVADAIASVGLYGLIVGRFGVKGGLVGGPMVTALLAIPLFFLGLLGPATLGLLLAASGLKLIDVTARENISEPVVTTLYHALPVADRGVAQAAGSTVVGPLGALLAAPILWAVLGPLDLGIPGLIILVFASGAVWTWVSLRAGNEWPAALKRALDRGAPDQADVTLAGREGLETLLDGLASADPTVVLGSARLLRGTAPALLREHLPLLLAHRDDDLRIEILRLLETRPLRSAVGPLAARLPSPISIHERALLYRALAASDPGEGGKLLEARLARATLSERGMLLDALLRHGGDAGAVVVGRQLHKLKEGVAAERRVAAVLLGISGGALPGGLLVSLLADEDRGVRREALAAVGRSGRDAPWAEAFACVDDPDLLGDIERAVHAGGGGALKALDRVWDGLSTNRRIRLLAAAAGSESTELRGFLLRRLDDPQVAREAISALRSTEPLTPDDEARLREAVDAELATVAQTTAHAAALRHQHLAVAARALREDADAALARAVAGLGLLHPGRGLDDLDHALTDPEERPLAIEVLESVLDRSDWLRLQPFLDPSEEEEPQPLGEVPVGASSWARLCLGDLGGARARAEDLNRLRAIPRLAHLRDRELAALADETRAEGGIPLSDDPSLGVLPVDALAALLLDVPALRVPLLDLLAGGSIPSSSERPRQAPRPLADAEALLALRSCPSFIGTPRSVQRSLVAAAESRELTHGQVVPRGPAGYALLVASGVLLDEEGNKVTSGALVGARAALRAEPRSTLLTSDGSSAVLVLPAGALRAARAASAPASLAFSRELLQGL